MQLPKDTWPNDWVPFGKGKLLPQGTTQEYNLGKKFREFYILQQHYLPQDYKQALLKKHALINQIHVYSTPFSRTILSAQALLYGLYPTKNSINNLIPVHMLEDTNKKRSPIPIYKELSTQGNNQYFNQCIQDYNTHIYPALYHLTDITGLKFHELKGLLGILSNYKSIVSLSDNITIYDALSLRRHLQTLGLSKTEIINVNNMKNACWAMLYNIQIYAAVHEQGILQNIAQTIKNTLKQPSVKYTLFLSHDSTLSAIMKLIGQPLPYQPNFASHIHLEVIKENTGEYLVKIEYYNTPNTPLIKPDYLIKMSLSQFFQKVANL